MLTLAKPAQNEELPLFEFYITCSGKCDKFNITGSRRCDKFYITGSRRCDKFS